MEARFQTFTVLITSVYRCIHKIKSEEMAEFDLKSNHVSCLYYLYNQESLTSKELCDICGEDKANVSRAIKHLETNGFLICNSKSPKRYQSPLVLTEKGKMVGQCIVKKIDDILEEASKGLSEEHRMLFYQSLGLINGNLKKICAQYDAT